MGPLLMTQETVFGIVREAVALVCEVDAGALARETRLVEDLAADSLALVEIVEVTEALFRERGEPFVFADERLDVLATIGDMVDEVSAAGAIQAAA